MQIASLFAEVQTCLEIPRLITLESTLDADLVAIYGGPAMFWDSPIHSRVNS